MYGNELCKTIKHKNIGKNYNNCNVIAKKRWNWVNKCFKNLLFLNACVLNVALKFSLHFKKKRNKGDT